MPTSEPTRSNPNEHKFSDNIRLSIEGNTFVMKIRPFDTEEFEVIKIQIPKDVLKSSPEDVFNKILDLPIYGNFKPLT